MSLLKSNEMIMVNRFGFALQSTDTIFKIFNFFHIYVNIVALSVVWNTDGDWDHYLLWIVLLLRLDRFDSEEICFPNAFRFSKF